MFTTFNISTLITAIIGLITTLIGSGGWLHYRAKNRKLLAEAKSAEHQARMDQIEMNKAQSSHNKEVISDLKKENEELRNENRTLKKQVSDLETKNFQLETKVSVLQEQNRNLTETVNEMKAQIKELYSHILNSGETKKKVLKG